MRSKIQNTTHVEGYIYDHKLEARVSGENSKNPGTQFIMGTLDVATDNAITNIVTVHFTYVTPTTAKGNTNATYEVLKGIIDGKYKTVMGAGKENAHKVRIDSTIGLNEWYSDRNGTNELVSTKRNEGGFVHITDSLNVSENDRNTFKADMVITSVTRYEENTERGIPEHVILKGCIFDYKRDSDPLPHALLPIEFTVNHPGAMNYFESLDASSTNPVFTWVSGVQVSQTINRTIVEESAWGEEHVRTVTSSKRDWVVTNSPKETYVFGEDITPAELTKLMQDRETYLATIKTRQEEYKASKNTAPAPAAPKASAGGFNF